VQLQQVCLTKLDNFSRLEDAHTLAAQVARTGPHALLGGFVHSTNWQPQALRYLLQAAQAHELDVDLHVDEELNPAAQGLATAAKLLREMDFAGRVVCGHVCALAAQPLSDALATLDAVARAPITLVSLPATNLLLQDATPGRTPRLRGITLVKEARARGIPLLFASDNVQDPFCRLGSFDPVESMLSAATVAQLDAPYDTWSDSLCRADFLQRGPIGPAACVGAWADLVIFTQADAVGWPSRAAERVVLRQGQAIHGVVPERFRLSSLDQLA
jgi:cytosine deaminase